MFYNIHDCVMIDHGKSRSAGWVADMDADGVTISPHRWREDGRLTASDLTYIPYADIWTWLVIERDALPDGVQVIDPPGLLDPNVWTPIDVTLPSGRKVIGHWNGTDFMYVDEDRWFAGQSDSIIVQLEEKPTSDLWSNVVGGLA